MQPAVKHSCMIRVPSDLSPMEVGQFERLLFAGVADQPGRLILDCGTLDRVVSSHVALLWRAHTLCQDAAIDLRLLNPPLALMRVLNVLDLTHTFKFEGGAEAESLHVDKDMLAANLPCTFTDCAHADITDIDLAIQRFVRFLGGFCVSATSVLELKTIYYEVATNIRCHSGLTHADKFSIDVRADYNGITMSFADPGRAFDPTTSHDSIDAEEASRAGKRRGFGLIMIRRLCDRMEYRRDDTRGNLLTIIKEWHK